MKTERYLMMLLTIFFLMGAGASRADSNEEIKHFRVKRLNDTYIDAYLKRPQNREKKVGLLYILQGTGCLPSRDRLFGLEEQWNIRGRDKVAVLMTEKVGVGQSDNPQDCSDEYRRHHTFPQRVHDASRVIQHLRNTATWWNGKLYILGGSEGGALAAVLGSFIPETEKIVILVAGGSMNLAEAILFNIEKSMRQAGASEFEILLAKQQQEAMFSEVRANPTPNLLLGTRDPELGSVYQESYKFFDSALDVRPLNALVDIFAPIYMAHGTEDLNDPVETVYDTIDRFTELGKNNLVYREYTGLDHGFNDINGVSHMGEVLMEAFDWLFDSIDMGRPRHNRKKDHVDTLEQGSWRMERVNKDEKRV